MDYIVHGVTKSQTRLSNFHLEGEEILSLSSILLFKESLYMLNPNSVMFKIPLYIENSWNIWGDGGQKEGEIVYQPFFAHAQQIFLEYLTMQKLGPRANVSSLQALLTPWFRIRPLREAGPSPTLTRHFHKFLKPQVFIWLHIFI